MKVILTQEIKGRGGEGDVIEVKHGFAVNYLFPNKLAIKATRGELKQLELRRHNIEKREVARMDDANQAVEYLSGKVVGIAMKVGEEGRLFGSVTAHMIADALQEQHGLEIDRRKIEVHAPIKELGDHVVDINVYRELKAPITVRVVPDGEAIDIGMTAEEAAELVDSGEITDAFAADDGFEQERMLCPRSPRQSFVGSDRCQVICQECSKDRDNEFRLAGLERGSLHKSEIFIKRRTAWYFRGHVFLH